MGYVSLLALKVFHPRGYLAQDDLRCSSARTAKVQWAASWSSQVQNLRNRDSKQNWTDSVGKRQKEVCEGDLKANPATNTTCSEVQFRIISGLMM